MYQVEDMQEAAKEMILYQKVIRSYLEFADHALEGISKQESGRKLFGKSIEHLERECSGSLRYIGELIKQAMSFA